MNDFIYKIEKIESDDDIKLDIYSTNNSLKTQIKTIEHYYTIFTIKDDFNNLNIKNDKLILSNKDFYNKKGEIVIKIKTKNKELYKYISKKLKDNELEHYEADLINEHKHLINNNIDIYPSKTDKEPQLKYISIDIETIKKDDSFEIIMISSYSPLNNGTNKVYVNCEKLSIEKIDELRTNNDNLFKIVIKKNEHNILEEFRDDIIEFSPQVILGWNVIDFDFKVIRDRMRKNNIKFKFSKYDRNECKLRINKDFYKDSTMDCSGTLILDGIMLLKTNFISFDDYKLDTVAKEVLKDTKIDVKSENDTDENNNKIENKGKDIENMFYSNPLKLAEYNFKDSLLVSQIIEKLNVLNLMIKRSIITNTPISKVKSPIATLDIMYLKELHKQNIVAPSNFNFNRGNPISGGYVIEPTRGFYNDVFVFDFKSLYPSIIMTFNIDPFSFNEDENGKIVAPNNATFDKKKGILPEIILKLYKQRDIAKKEKDEIKSYAIKTTMNSFYGAMGSSKSRFYNDRVGSAITAFAQYIIKKAKKIVEDKGHKVIYGDTDSVFVQINKLSNKSLADKKKAGFELEKSLNTYFKSWVNDEFGQNNYLEIELEKLYSNFFIASKKRYVGYDEFKSKIGFIGMEAIRGDWTQLAKEFQIKLIDLVFSNKDEKVIVKFILDYVDKLKSGEFDNLLIYKKKITKPLSEYTKMTPPHVKAAREVKDFSGRLVKYVLTENGPKHISLINNITIYDYKHYIEKQLKGVSDDILECLNIDFTEVVKSKSQKSLNRFF